MSSQTTPNETQIRDCINQIKDKGNSSYGNSVQKYARLRLFNFSEILDEWHNPTHPLPASARALPNVAAALNADLTPEQGSKMVAFLQHQAKSGNTTALLYLAYLHIFARHVPASLKQTALYVRHASQAGDWRASRLWAELLFAAPQAAQDLLETDTQAQAQQWQQRNSNIAADKINAAVQRYYAAPTVIKMAIKAKLELAASQGSPTAAKRLLGLTVLGEIPRHQAAPQFQKIANWLDVQLLRPESRQSDDPDIMLLPENVPLLPQGDDEDEKPVWWKPFIYGCVGIIATLLFVLILKAILKP